MAENYYEYLNPQPTMSPLMTRRRRSEKIQIPEFSREFGILECIIADVTVVRRSSQAGLTVSYGLKRTCTVALRVSN